MRVTQNVAALVCMSGIASSLRRKRRTPIRPADWGVPPEDLNDTHVHCGEVRIRVEEHLAKGVWPLEDPAVTQAQACVNGMAGSYPCSGIDLLGFMPLSTFGQSEANDIWGWTDPQTGKEYAIMGVRAGTVFVDVSDPESPQYLVYVRTHTSASTWRDIKVYNNRAYIVSEASGHGMQVYDLTRLRGVASVTEHSPDAHMDNFGQAHNVVINEASGRAYAVGARSLCSGGLVIIDIKALQPQFLGCFSADGYTHDAECVIYNGPDTEHVGKEICAAYNEDTLTIVDVTNAASPVQLSRTPYGGSRYTHQGWFDGEQRYIYANDELDESRSDPKTRTLIFNAEDLDNVQFVEKFYHDTDSIDHNNYFHNGYLYQGNYCAGVRVLKVWPDHKISQAAFFDTEPQCSEPVFEGIWSVYPYFQSGIIVASSIEKGLFVLKFSDDFTGPEPTTTPVPTPAPPPGSWSVVGNGCVLEGDCIHSLNYPSNYGNNEACTVQLYGSIPLAVDGDLMTERNYDKLMVSGVEYHGTPPPNLADLDGLHSGSLTWNSDGSVVNKGWRICRTDGNPSPGPTPTPVTPSPTPAPTQVPTTPQPTPPPTPMPTPTPPSPPPSGNCSSWCEPPADCTDYPFSCSGCCSGSPTPSPPAPSPPSGGDCYSVCDRPSDCSDYPSICSGCSFC